MTDIENITTDGFNMPDQAGRLTGLTGIALFSLKIALKAYFSTYRSMSYGLHLFDTTSNRDQKTIDFNHSSSYWEGCAEAIIHFQHFVELVCKDLLRLDHPLLAVDASPRHVILHKLLRGEPVCSADHKGLKSVEFSEALERLCALIKAGRIGNGKLDFILDAKTWLLKLNFLRNRLWHRGIFILRYPALDKLIGQFVLPIVERVIALPTYSGLQEVWKYEDLKSGIDPIEIIVSDFKRGEYNLRKIALLKELGRAAYKNPLTSNPLLGYENREHQRQAERIAEAEAHKVADVLCCPVCGVKSLIVYDDIEHEDEDPSTGTYKRAWRFTYAVNCVCCTFSIDRHLENASVYGLPIKDYWHSEEL